MKGLQLFLVLASLVGNAIASPAPVVNVKNPRNLAEPAAEQHEERSTTVSITIPAGTVIGIQQTKTESYNGIPFAQAPVGNLRLRPPVRITTALDNWDGTGPANSCPQFVADSDSSSFLDEVVTVVSDTSLFKTALKISEDCLSVTVTRPIGTKAGDNLPVLFWIFGGGFELGWSSMYDMAGIVGNGIDYGKPYIMAAVNYRVAAWGFMGGKEILADGAANIGLLDQRMGLEWVADNIAAFGGDPTKVTIWGESAGAISVWDQMALYDGDNTYNGKPLFRAGIMNSGSVVPADPVDCPKAQATYDAVVAASSCKGSSDSLNCLRNLSLDDFTAAANSVPGILSYNSVALQYLPRPDGTVLTDSPEKLLKANKYAAVPMIIGDQEDEGTLFSLFQSNTTSTTAKLVNYLSTIFFHDASTATITGLVNTYPSSLISGSPYNTGILNEIYPGFKRLAAILGDAVFTLTRRIMLTESKTLNPSVPAWSYIASYDYGTPILGTFHGSDLIQVFFGILPNYAAKNVQKYYFNFVYNMNPNDYSGGTSTTSKVSYTWPEWTTSGLNLVRFYSTYFTSLTDSFRSDSATYLANNIDSFHI